MKPNKQEIIQFLKESTTDGLLPWASQKTASETFSIDIAEVERTALKQEIVPARYQRNQPTISSQDQLQLLNSTVAIIGCGGLGGYIIEQLARIGVGRLVVIDPDTFEEHNLNRQILSTVDCLGQAKTAAAVSRVLQINPAVKVEPHQQSFCRSNAHQLLQKVDVVADALDNIPARLELAQSCTQLNIPLVHGAITGWYGQVSTQLPGEGSIEKIYRNSMVQDGENEENRVDSLVSTLAPTPAVIASIQVTEICKLLLEKGQPLQGRQLCIDLLDMSVEEFPI